MKRYFFTLFAFFFLLSFSVQAQNTFDEAAYRQFVEEHLDINAAGLQTLHPLKSTYLKGFAEPVKVEDYAFLDSVILKMELTNQELDLLNRNRFMVTERMSYLSFGDAIWDIYKKDLPVMITTDLVLHSLHKSYDSILKSLEYSIMYPNLLEYLQTLYANFNNLKSKYADNEDIKNSINDIDVYVTAALSLIKNETQKSQNNNQDRIKEVLDFIEEEAFVTIPLFGETPLRYDFSQFKPRGHYTESPTLQQYFKAMMWLGRVPFYLTPPPNILEFIETDIKRANTDAFLLNELQNLAGVENLMKENNTIIDNLVGESDNITPTEYDELLSKFNIKSIEDLYSNYDTYYEALQNDEDFTSRIASFPYFGNPPETGSAELPISYKLSGQRFVIDSEIFSNVVYDRVPANPLHRLMPDPLDALICMGNNDAIDLMQTEIDEYKYASHLANQRYLIEHKEKEYWQSSFYGSWLNAIKLLGETNPAQSENAPQFMKTAAWQQQKINTQLAAWTQLRHDNLLYAAQSYTGSPACCFPHSYVEPYPEFYEAVAQFAKQSYQFFETIQQEDSRIGGVINYFKSFEHLNNQFKELAEKALNKTPYSEQELEFLKSMFHTTPGCAGEDLSGWITQLYYYGQSDFIDPDFITADVHTQPADEVGTVVGNVLHVGNGTIDMGVFLAPSPSHNFELMAFVGPVSSYYEYINSDFERSNDEEWAMRVVNEEVGERPDWVNIYLATDEGDKRSAGRELPSVKEDNVPLAIIETPLTAQWQLYPNPATEAVQIITQIDEVFDDVLLRVSDISGKEIITYHLNVVANQANVHKVQLSQFSAGLYNFTLLLDGQQSTRQVLISR